MQGGLHTAGIHRCGSGRRRFHATLATGEQQHGVAMHGREAAQEIMRRLRQRNEAIPVAFGVADVHASACRIDIAELQPQPFAEA